MGGADAKGTAEDTSVVYTPAVMQERGIALTYVTLEEGYFWSDAIQSPAGELLRFMILTSSVFHATSCCGCTCMHRHR